MYKLLDKLLAEEMKRIRVSFNHLGSMGFDELNVINTRKATQNMYNGFLKDNEGIYLKVARDAYKRATDGSKKVEIDREWLVGVLAGYNLVTGYLYNREADRKRLRLNEQILTAREYGNRQMFQDSLRRSANLWWTQTSQYGISVVDEATIKGFRDMGVKRVQWIAADDEKTCPTCGARDNKIYSLNKIPPKPHYGCRCYVVPVKEE
jgi:SPP1 gp7 family putative phage head morphogenesis protein